MERRLHTRHRARTAVYVSVPGRPGKLEIVPTKPMTTQRDLSLAYSPGVAVPVRVARFGTAVNPSLGAAPKTSCF